MSCLVRHKQNLRAKLLAQTGDLPFLALESSSHSPPAFLRSSADLKRWKSELTSSERISLLAELERRRHPWDQAAAQLGYTSANALENHLAEREALLRRVLWIRRPVTPLEVAAKLHCLLVTQDPAAQLKDQPWPELRTILDDILLLAAAKEQDGRLGSEGEP
jgi:hypothetical protein